MKSKWPHGKQTLGEDTIPMIIYAVYLAFIKTYKMLPQQNNSKPVVLDHKRI